MENQVTVLFVVPESDEMTEQTFARADEDLLTDLLAEYQDALIDQEAVDMTQYLAKCRTDDMRESFMVLAELSDALLGK